MLAWSGTDGFTATTRMDRSSHGGRTPPALPAASGDARSQLAVAAQEFRRTRSSFEVRTNRPFARRRRTIPADGAYTHHQPAPVVGRSDDGLDRSALPLFPSPARTRRAAVHGDGACAGGAAWRPRSPAG